MKSRALLYFSIGAALALLAQGATATVFVIPNGDVASLKSAIATSNTNNLDDTIELATNGTYTLTARDNALNGLPAIAPDGGHTLTIHGNGSTITRSSATTFRIFYVNSGANLTLDHLTITNGSLVAHGGAIYNDAETGDATLTITNCTFDSNTGDYGGAIYNDGFNDTASATTATLTVTNSTFSNNHGSQYGGAIWNDGSFGHASLTVSNSTFTKNTGQISTGAIQHDGFMGEATGSITNCTFDHNSANQFAGAIEIDGDTGTATLSVRHSTFYLNSAGTDGGAVDLNTSGAVLQAANDIFRGGAVFSQHNISGNGTV